MLQIKSRFVLAKKNSGVRCTLKSGATFENCGERTHVWTIRWSRERAKAPEKMSDSWFHSRQEFRLNYKQSLRPCMTKGIWQNARALSFFCNDRSASEHSSFNKNIVFPAEVEYSYFPVDLRLKIFLSIFLEITAYDILFSNVFGVLIALK